MTTVNDWNLIEHTLIKSSRIGDKSLSILNEFSSISFEEAKNLTGYRHAAHVMLWAKNPNKLWSFDLKASILMQMRFDGCLGFPGGLVAIPFYLPLP